MTASGEAGTGVNRREVLCGISAAAAAGALSASCRTAETAAVSADASYDISLAQWSLHRRLRAGMDNLEFAAFTRDEFDLGAVEYVNQFFQDKAADFDYLGEMKRRADDAGVRSLLIMIDGEGALADPDETQRSRAIENHFKWVVAAESLGCHAIRVNAAGSGGYDDQLARAADSLHQLASFADPHGIDVIVENHGGLSSNGAWLAAVMERADHPRVGTLPDFGNFHLGNDQWYDRYRGVSELMPYAKAVSAKSHEFDTDGNEVRTDFRRMMKIVVDAGYTGYVGIEYEGKGHSEPEGIRLTKALLERVRAEL